MRALLVLLVVLGCQGTTDYHNASGWGIKQYGYTHPSEPVVRTLVTEWFEAYFKTPLKDTRIEVRWAFTQCKDSNIRAAGIVRGDECLGGVSWQVGQDACDAIVAWRLFPSQSALVHEYAHCFRGIAKGDTDPGHNDSELWSMVIEFNQQLAKVGL